MAATAKKKPVPEETESGDTRHELVAFAALPLGLARLILRDGRPRKEIAEAAGINASMLSGYTSGRRLPSLEHLDRLLTTMGFGLEDLVYEMRSNPYSSPPFSTFPSSSLALAPQFFQTQQGEATGALLNVLLENLRAMLHAQAQAGAPLPAPAPAKETPRGGKRSAAPPSRSRSGR